MGFVYKLCLERACPTTYMESCSINVRCFDLTSADRAAAVDPRELACRQYMLLYAGIVSLQLM